MSPSKGPKSSTEAKARVKKVLDRHMARKPAHAAQVTLSWESALSSVVGFLTSLDGAAAVHGQPWKASMMRYYGRKLSDLLTAPPPGAEGLAKEYLAKYGKLLPK